MNHLYTFKRPFIWLSRFRNRCGYGVHSPFAFSLITDVIYEKRSYYAYAVLEAEYRKKLVPKGNVAGERRINRLLFRLVNKVQPTDIIEVGHPSITSLYLQSAKPSAHYRFVSELSEFSFGEATSIFFLYLNDYQYPDLLEKAFQMSVDYATPDSLFVVYGVGYSKAMKLLWSRMQKDDRVGITFDLYDVGLLFFDKTKIKQHYIVNF